MGAAPADGHPARRRTGSAIRRFRAAEDGLAAAELALILPVLLTIMLGGIQLVAYINAVRKVELVVQSISQMISQTSPPDASTSVATVNAADLHFSYDAALVLFPYLMDDAKRQGKSWWQDITINYASIQFTQVATTCSDGSDLSACYVANVVWTSTGTTQPASGAAFRPCGVPQVPAANNAAPTRSALPRSVYGPASLIVVDVVFTFTPTFGTQILQPIRIARSAYVQPRYASLVNYDTTNNDGIATRCPGF
ncbi:TadE/TadG family type IV pilus assembly protein [Methylobacterium nonmethylotrophicum]|uniref:Pilus assembly protein n=1 Tax=Methylobacterium nonmethylotrophicum TaxID=1141884 RepID=A0A4Z0NPQ4_9HYPH|nr:TadE/TadG family type IV pilus assembly protein [Methylobacterium nonmethylotrophicum]TGD98628.1 pilus assembly protein [Methylobacterium nonmethylotrophicum]